MAPLSAEHDVNQTTTHNANLIDPTTQEIMQILSTHGGPPENTSKWTECQDRIRTVLTNRFGQQNSNTSQATRAA